MTVLSSASSSSSSIHISSDRLKSLDKPRRKLHGPNSSGLKQKKLKKDKFCKNLKNGSNPVNQSIKTKNVKKREKTNSYINSSDRPYFIFFLYILTSLFLGINAIYQYKVSKTGIFHEELNIFNVSKYIFSSFMPILLIAVWVSTILTKMRFLLGKMIIFFLKNLKFFMKPEVILFFIVSFISYRVLLFIPILFKYIHSVSDFIPYGGPIVSFTLLITFIFLMFFLIGWMIILFSYDVSDSIVKFISNTTSFIFGKSLSKFSKKKVKKNYNNEEIVDDFDN